MVKKSSRVKSVHQLMAQHPSVKYCIHDISRVFDIHTKDASSILNYIVKAGGATKTFKDTCDDSPRIKHYNYRYLGKLGKLHRKHQKHQKRGSYRIIATSRAICTRTSQVTQLRTENQKLRAKNEVLVEMLRDALKR
jgi:hypothetical protein